MAGDTNGHVHVTVTGGGRRADLALPLLVPVAELVPELARLLDVLPTTGRLSLTALGGREFVAAAGLGRQGVADGDILVLSTESVPPPRLYDDLAEAVADAVSREPTFASGRPIALGSAALLLALGAAALALDAGSRSALAGGLMGALLIGVSAACAKAGQQWEAVGAAWLGWLHAGVAGGLAGVPLGAPLLGTGVSGVLVGGTSLIIVRRLELAPPLVLSIAVAVAGVCQSLFGLSPALALTSVLAAGTLAGAAAPGFALTVVGLQSDLASVSTVELDRVQTQVRSARRIQVATLAALGLMTAALAPSGVSRGLAGTGVGAVAAALLLLRMRGHRSTLLVRTGLASGLAGVLSVVVSVFALQPDWRGWSFVVLMATAVAVGVGILRPWDRRAARLADLAETGCLVAIAPLAVLASGALSGGVH